MKRAIILLTLLLVSQTVFPCLIFVFTQGSHVLVGNHEDWTARDARVRFVPATGKLLGAVVFDFESEGLIQGGMNTAGLFFDGTATPFTPLDFSAKEDFKGKDFWLTLLQSASTVQEAVAFVQKYKVPELEKVHLLFADRSGQSVIVGAYDGTLTLTWKTVFYQVLSNFNIVDPEFGGEQPCPRFATATKILTGNITEQREAAKLVLQQTTQGELTVYSTLFDLTEGTVEVFYIGNFSKSIILNLRNELALGPHVKLLSKQLR